MVTVIQLLYLKYNKFFFICQYFILLYIKKILLFTKIFGGKIKKSFVLKKDKNRDKKLIRMNKYFFEKNLRYFYTKKSLILSLFET